VAVKCDNCGSRVSQGLVPACVEVCKVGALVYEELSDAMAAKTRQVARCMSAGAGEATLPAGVALIRAAKQSQLAVGTE
jgi:carbon-monoxide dehydrogenase iron sulfur subunit